MGARAGRAGGSWVGAGRAGCVGEGALPRNLAARRSPRACSYRFGPPLTSPAGSACLPPLWRPSSLTCDVPLRLPPTAPARPASLPAVVGDVSALTPGGVRIGAPAMTSRGLLEQGGFPRGPPASQPASRCHAYMCLSPRLVHPPAILVHAHCCSLSPRLTLCPLPCPVPLPFVHSGAPPPCAHIRVSLCPAVRPQQTLSALRRCCTRCWRSARRCKAPAARSWPTSLSERRGRGVWYRLCSEGKLQGW